MISKQAAEELLELYLCSFPGERERVQLFVTYLATTNGRLTDRKNFDGHITASAFVIDVAASEMLLLQHKSLGRWLQPGGHTDAGDATLQLAALREAVEETGIPAAQLRYIPATGIPTVPLDIDSHYIPANPKKAEEGHYHHDIRYLFAYTGTRENSYNEDEATGLKWVPYAQLAADPLFAGVIAKVHNLA